MLSYMLGVEAMRPHGLEPEQLKRQIALAARTLAGTAPPTAAGAVCGRGPTLGRRGIGRSLARPSGPVGRPAPDDPTIKPARGPAAVTDAGSPVDHPARPSFGGRDPHAGRWPVRASGRQHLQPAARFHRVACQWQSTVRRGDCPRVAGAERAGSTRRSVGVHGGVQRGGCSCDLAGAAAVAHRPTADRCSPRATGGGRAGVRFRRAPSERHRCRGRYHRG